VSALPGFPVFCAGLCAGNQGEKDEKSEFPKL